MLNSLRQLSEKSAPKQTSASPPKYISSTVQKRCLAGKDLSTKIVSKRCKFIILSEFGLLNSRSEMCSFANLLSVLGVRIICLRLYSSLMN
jgi:Golgi nucleoside diphosphatase